MVSLRLPGVPKSTTPGHPSGPPARRGFRDLQWITRRATWSRGPNDALFRHLGAAAARTLPASESARALPKPGPQARAPGGQPRCAPRLKDTSQCDELPVQRQPMSERACSHPLSSTVHSAVVVPQRSCMPVEPTPKR